MSIIRDLFAFKARNIIFDHNSILYYTEAMSLLLLQTPICAVQHVAGTAVYITCNADLCRVVDAVDAAYLARCSSYEAYLKACQTAKPSLYFNINGQRNLLKIHSENINDIMVSNKIKLILQPVISNNGIMWIFKQFKIIQQKDTAETIIEDIEPAVDAVETAEMIDAVEAVEAVEIEEFEELDTDTQCCLANELHLIPCVTMQ